jgi:hypothetical protein
MNSASVYCAAGLRLGMCGAICPNLLSIWLI